MTWLLLAGLLVGIVLVWIAWRSRRAERARLAEQKRSAEERIAAQHERAARRRERQ